MKIVAIHHDGEALALFQKIGVDPYGIGAMTPKTRHVNILLSARPCKVANILKQEMLSLGADAAVSRGSVSCAVEATDVLLMGTHKQIGALAGKIENQPFGLDVLARDLRVLLGRLEKKPLLLKTVKREIVLGERTLIMGVLNVTPDSFSDGRRYLNFSSAVNRGLQMAEEGADIIDIGGESTRPGAKTVALKEEIARVVPVVEELSAKLTIPLSVDTMKAGVADKALKAGAEIVNDVSALSGDRKMASVVRKASAALVLMHMRGIPADMQEGDLRYADLTGEIFMFLEKAVQKALAAGISRERLVVDPGIGFGKTHADNCRILNKLCEFRALGLPLLVGTSRKAFIGSVTGDAVDRRMEGTAATVAAAVMNGCHIIRVHDVAAMKKVAAMTDAIVRAGMDS
ncbi:MAG: dihydropteroate synthase [Smithellaceae bacterium]|nr:dihydropteroate synthase [Smithellaceae bacterium]MDD3258021.1 dihydropteroate synthase [Smithellaceae bacterium]MDD3848120.1 dihydropteroate synthase [Smithellaceae bacterium]HOG11807.1 dihydropteroate synthase [Smithellaceae bacterium]HOQ72524.1 dihydropteroate synthase [Smithellaceae bacterium]